MKPVHGKAGKTAIKASLNKYLFGEETSEAYGNPIANLVVSTFRSWTNTDRDFVPDCDLLVTGINGECGAMADPNFGKAVPGTTYDPDVLAGWGTRGYNWELSAGVQHELMPSVSIDVGYFRRWYGNFTTTDNRALSASDFDAFNVTAPSHPDLPGGGGYVISGISDLNDARFGVPADNFVTFADAYGKQIEHWNGVDLSINTRVAEGVLLQGGIATGRTTTDNCDVKAKLPELSPTTPTQYCHVDTAFLTQVKLLGSYNVPRVDVRISATYQNIPGPQVAANVNVRRTSTCPAPLSQGRSAGRCRAARRT